MSSGQQNAAVLICGMAWVAKMKTHYTVELVAMQLRYYPPQKDGCCPAQMRENWPYQRQTGTGGRNRYFAVPDKVADLIAQRNAVAVAASKAIVPTTAQLPTLTTDPQQLVADARTGIVQHIELMQARSGYSLDKACSVLLDMKPERGKPTRNWSPCSNMPVTRAAIEPRTTMAVPSVRSLHRFVERSITGSLVPVRRERPLPPPNGRQHFWPNIKRRKKRTVAAAYALFAAKWDDHPLPSVCGAPLARQAGHSDPTHRADGVTHP